MRAGCGEGWHPRIVPSPALRAGRDRLVCVCDLVPPAHWAASLGIDRLLGRVYALGQSPALSALGVRVVAILPLLVLLAFPNALGEELGWRGFVLPRLQARHSALTASVVVGLFWGFWHIPTWVAQKLLEMSVWSAFSMVVSTIPAAILFTWVYNNTRGSLVPVCLLHASIALTGYFTPALPTPTHTVLSWVVAVIIVAGTGPACLSRHAARVQLPS